jgi:hypothetical protein
MENNTKIAIGLAAAVVVGYIVYKSKNPKSTTSSGKCTGEFAVECNDGSCDVGNGDSLPCLGKRGGVKGGANYNTGSTLASIAMSTPTSMMGDVIKSDYGYMPSVSKEERDCSFEYAMSAHPMDMPSEETRARREADFIKRCLELKSRLSIQK